MRRFIEVVPLHHPKGLAVLCLAELFEKFSYFGTRALLVYYMLKQLAMAPSQASLIFGMFGASMYAATVPGAVVADRYIGRASAVLLGGVLIAIGNFAMCLEPLFLPGLGLLALGSGLFLPSLPPQVGSLYAAGDARGDAGFSFFFLCSNLGAFLGVSVCATAGEFWGGEYGFAAAGVAMCAGIAIYWRGRALLPPTVSSVASDLPGNDATAGMPALRTLLAIAAAVVMFRIPYDQIGNTLVVWADTEVDRQVLQFTLPVTWFQSLNPLFVLLLTPLMLAASSRWAHRLSTPRKMMLGAATAALAYVLLAILSYYNGLGHSATHWSWLVLFLLLLTAAEIWMLPLALGLFVRLAPARLGATTVAGWFMVSLAGSLLAGLLGATWSSSTAPVFFMLMALLALASMVILAITGVLRCEWSPAALRLSLKE